MSCLQRHVICCPVLCSTLLLSRMTLHPFKTVLYSLELLSHLISSRLVSSHQRECTECTVRCGASLLYDLCSTRLVPFTQFVRVHLEWNGCVHTTVRQSCPVRSNVCSFLDSRSTAARSRTTERFERVAACCDRVIQIQLIISTTDPLFSCLLYIYYTTQ